MVVMEVAAVVVVVEKIGVVVGEVVGGGEC